jgi:hypothetical protein
MKYDSRLDVGLTAPTTKPTRLYIAAVPNYKIISDKFKSSNLYLNSCSGKDNEDNVKDLKLSTPRISFNILKIFLYVLHHAL